MDNFLQKKLGNKAAFGIVVGIAIFIICYAGGKQLIEKYNNAQNKIALLEEQVNMLQDEVLKITGENSQFATSLQSLQNRQTAPIKTQEEIVTSTVAKINPSVVSVKAVRDITFRGQVIGQRVGSGSGFIISSNGYIVTNRHVTNYSGATYSVILPSGTEIPAKVVYQDQSNDIAVMKIDRENMPKADLGNSTEVALGQTVIAVGNALGEFSNSISVGIVSGLNRTIEAEDSRGIVEKIDGTIQTDAAINPGNSGGPLVNVNGQVIGVNVATVLGSNSISFAIPIDVVKGILKNLGI